MKKSELRSLIKEEISTLFNESEASEKAKKMGLTYLGFGRYGKNGKATHKVVGKNLIDIAADKKKKQAANPYKSPRLVKYHGDPMEFADNLRSRYGVPINVKWVGDAGDNDFYAVYAPGTLTKDILKQFKQRVGQLDKRANAIAQKKLDKYDKHLAAGKSARTFKWK